MKIILSNLHITVKPSRSTCITNIDIKLIIAWRYLSQIQHQNTNYINNIDNKLHISEYQPITPWDYNFTVIFIAFQQFLTEKWVNLTSDIQIDAGKIYNHHIFFKFPIVFKIIILCSSNINMTEPTAVLIKKSQFCPAFRCRWNHNTQGERSDTK